MTAPIERNTFADLLGVALSQLAKLFQNEVDLARAELAEKASEVGNALKYVTAGAIIVIPALVLVLFAIATEMVALGLSPPLSYLVTGVVAGLFALMLIVTGANRLSGQAMKPSVTVDQIRRDKAVAEEIIR
jgi:protein-S-isoprenylcysteine O-methyltransferase Ste14